MHLRSSIGLDYSEYSFSEEIISPDATPWQSLFCNCGEIRVTHCNAFYMDAEYGIGGNSRSYSGGLLFCLHSLEILGIDPSMGSHVYILLYHFTIPVL